ncbi:MAG: phytoene desaturase family protein [Terriglobales bacterium]
MNRKACVIGAGPNGLAAAVVLARAGLQVDVLEAETTAGGAVRTMELTLPGYRHDFGAAVFPLGAGSPFFSSLPLRDYGLEWLYSPAVLAHPLDDGTAVILERDLSDTQTSLGVDGQRWKNLVQPLVEHWTEFAPDVLGSFSSLPKHPWLMARFGMSAVRSAGTIARRFSSERTRALYAGLAAHSFLTLEEPLSAAAGMLMAVTAHAVGWPIPRGGSQSLTDALCQYLAKFGSKVATSSPVEALAALSGYDLILCDVTPRQLLKLGGQRLSNHYQHRLQTYRYGPGVFKVDYALHAPIPWKASDCLRAATLHLGGSFQEIAASERAVRQGQHAERPFVLLAQQSLFDPSRAPQGKHTAWAYCHVPNGSRADVLSKLEDQIERFAPGFRDCVVARCVSAPSDLEKMDANLVGGDIGGGTLDLRQFLFRPTRRHYATSAKDIYICSSSTPPGGGVHGMCGYHAAQMALSRLKPS